MENEQKNTTQKPLSREKLNEALANMFSGDSYQTTYVFYGHMIGQCSIVLERMKAPAAVSFHLDHYKLHINPELFDEFTLEERLAVLKHEMLHILNGHVGRKEDRNHKAWNYATDCAINQLIDQKHLPQGCIIPATLPSKTKVPDKLSGEQYYEYIDKDQLPEDDEQTGPGTGKPGPLDDHSKWQESEGDADLQKDITRNMIEKAVNETQKSRGDVPGQISDYLNMFSRKSEVDWKKKFKRYVSNKKANFRKTILRRDRRNPNFEHIKGKTKDHIADPVIVGDESGSVSNTELVSAIGECIHICKSLGTEVWYVPVDTQAHKPHILKRSQRTFKRSACGGTTLSPAIAKLKEAKINATVIVVITDGYIDESDVAAYKATNKPIIWLITSEGQIMDSMNAGRMSAIKLKNEK